MQTFKTLINIILILFLSNKLSIGYTESKIQLDYQDQKKYQHIDSLLGFLNTNPETIHKELYATLEKSKTENDSLVTLKCLIGLGDIERFRGNYDLAFEYFWDALHLANQINHLQSITQVNRNLGILYNIFNKDSLALTYYSISLSQAKQLIAKDSTQKQQLASCYFSIGSYYQRLQNDEMAFTYLDSCSWAKNNPPEMPFVDAEKGIIHLRNKQYDKANAHLQKANKDILSIAPIYQIVIQHRLGQLKYEIGQKDSALYFFTKSLEGLEKQQSHLELKPNLLKKISTLEMQKGNAELAYNHLLEANQASYALFDATNQSNGRLFEIKNKYQVALAEKDNVIENQNTTIEQKNRTLRLLSIVAIFLVLATLSIYYLIHLQTRIKRLSLEQKLEKEKTDAVLNAKSKELTSYTLQLIEKERLTNELLETIKKQSTSTYLSIKQKHNSASKKLWKDFNMRFVSINQEFYASLRTKHPELTMTEQKHCALIRLNLDNNEMAQILNISLQSVHTSRYRIRKKIGLAKNENLSKYITEL